MNRFNHDNNYKDGNTKLSLGNYVTIQDGTYNTAWEIAGFDMESNHVATDGTVYDNGYGICMIPYNQLTTATWNNSKTLTGAYKSSAMNTTHIPGIVTKLQNVLGSHIVQRNVLLSSSEEFRRSNAYTWTTAYATLMSAGQMTGKFASHGNKYDDGEANYKLPIFNNKDFKTGSDFWLRGIQDSNSNFYRAWYVGSTGGFAGYDVDHKFGVRPLIYLR